jgi:chitodextrinase
MSVRSAACVAGLVFAVVVTAAAAAPRPDRGSLKAPTNLRIVASSATSITLAWDAASNNSSSWWYCVQKSGQGCFRVDPPKTTFTMSNLMPGTTTHWSVVAVDSKGHRSASSNVVTYTTPADTTAPSPPPVVSASDVHPTRITVSWTASTDDRSAVWYRLFKDGVDVGFDPGGFRAHTFIGLTPSTTYAFHVTARDASGNTTTSDVLSVTTPPKRDGNAPTPPTNVTLSELQADLIYLDWEQSTDDTDPQSQILYEVYVNGIFAFEAWVIGNDQTSVYCREFGTGAVNRVVLHAVDTSGNRSGPSNEVLVHC